MSASNPTDLEKETLQRFYEASRSLISGGVVPVVCVQRSFEEAIAGLSGADTWRPTHISPKAVVEAVEGSSKNLQRAHGVVGDRLDRYRRTLEILTGEPRSFDEWWSFWRYHDATVLITRAEHYMNATFTYEELIEIPADPVDIFTKAGFGFKARKAVELAWIREVYNKMDRPRIRPESPRTARLHRR